jgi:hypothetical protein
MRKDGMEVIGNTASVRKYYRNHRDEIIKQKTLHACKQEGRIPRLSTMEKRQMQWNDVLQAFAEWQASRQANDGVRMKRETRLLALMQAA